MTLKSRGNRPASAGRSVALALIAFLAASGQAGAGQTKGNVHQRIDAVGMSAGVDPTGSRSRLFRSVVTYDSGGYQADSVAVADLNGDGKPDIVVANCGSCYGPPEIGQSGSVAVLLGNGDGTFQPAVAYGTGGTVPLFVAVADLNGDGKPDLVVVNRNSNNIGVLLGNGDGTFQSAQLYASGEAPAWVAIGDVNGDSIPDLVVADGDGFLGVLLGNGDGSFQGPVFYATGGPASYGVALADVNGDGKLDALVATGSDSKGAAGVLLGNGDGSFQPTVTYPVCLSCASFSSAPVVADVNGDGWPDLVVAAGDASVLFGNGDGTFQPVVAWKLGKRTSGSTVAVADVNFDNHLDLLLTDPCAGANCAHHGLVALLPGNGNGSFQTAQSYPAGGFLTNSVVIADLNGDRKPDLVVANMCADDTLHCQLASVGVLLSTRPFKTKTVVSSSHAPSHVGEAITLTAVIRSNHGAIPDGELVAFYDGRSLLASVPLAAGVATYTTSSFGPWEHPIKVIYGGDGPFAGSIGRFTQRVFKYETVTAVSSNLNPSHIGDAVTFTANVYSRGGPVPTGYVTFWDHYRDIGSGTLSGGVGSITLTNLTKRMHPIRATYWGDGYSLESYSRVLQQVVEK